MRAAAPQRDAMHRKKALGEQPSIGSDAKCRSSEKGDSCAEHSSRCPGKAWQDLGLDKDDTEMGQD